MYGLEQAGYKTKRLDGDLKEMPTEKLIVIVDERYKEYSEETIDAVIKELANRGINKTKRTIETRMLSTETETKTVKPPTEGAKTGVKIAGILMIIYGGLFGVITLLQFAYGLILESIEYFALAAWNLIFTIASIFIGIGIMKNKYWAYNWGIGTAVINAIWGAVQLFGQNIVIQAFFVPINIAIIILLSVNKNVFLYFKELSGSE